MTIQTYIRISAFTFLVFSICPPPARGQDTPPKTPSPPYVNPLMGDFTMVKKFTYKRKTQDQASNPNLTAEQKAVQKVLSAYKDPRELDVIQVGTVRRDTEIFIDGTSKESWRSGPWQFIQNPMHPDLYVVTTVKTGDSSFISGDFAELQWINGGAFKGEQTMFGVRCYVYRAGDETALVGELTGLPVYFESSAMQVSYTYDTPPATPLQLPEKLSKKLEEVKRAWGGG